MRKILFFNGLIFFISCTSTEINNTERSNVPANYSYFLKVTVSDGGTVTCYPHSNGIGMYLGIDQSKLTPCRNFPVMDGTKIKVPARSQVLLVASPKNGYSFSSWSNQVKEDSIVVNLDSFNTNISAFFRPIE